MARAEINGFEDLDKMFDLLDAKMKDITLKALDSAAPILVESASKAVSKKTGALSESFKATKAKNNKWGSYTVVRPTGYDDKGTNNYAKGAFLEYGTTVNGSPHSAPRPWRQRAVNTAKARVEEKLEQILTSEVNRIAD